MALKDSFGREITYLRVSVTEACNLRCAYCWSPEGISDSGEILSQEEILRLLSCAVSLGLVHLRLTGGEPLLRKNIVSLVGKIAGLPGLRGLSLTTNGVLLAEKARALSQAGLGRVNLSLDTLNPEKYKLLTQCGSFTQVISGLRAALAAGFKSVKVNVVALRGFNEGEVLDFVALTRNEPLSVRFIEVMPFGGGCRPGFGFIGVQEVKRRIEEVYPLVPYDGNHRNGPSQDYAVPGFRGTVGFIAPLSEGFCEHCNRLRLTARGRLRPCLDSETEVDMVPALRAGAEEDVLRALFAQAILAKPERHCSFTSSRVDGMRRVGG